MSQIKRYLAVCDELRDANPDERMANYRRAVSKKRVNEQKNYNKNLDKYRHKTNRYFILTANAVGDFPRYEAENYLKVGGKKYQKVKEQKAASQTLAQKEGFNRRMREQRNESRIIKSNTRKRDEGFANLYHKTGKVVESFSSNRNNKKGIVSTNRNLRHLRTARGKPPPKNLLY